MRTCGCVLRTTLSIRSPTWRLQRKVGARGLRMILEDLMLEMMYHLPAQRKLRDFVVTADMVKGREINWSLLEKAG